jgi:hypothetical protein
MTARHQEVMRTLHPYSWQKHCAGLPHSKASFHERGVIAFRRVRSAELVAIDGECDAQFSSHHRHANHGLWFVGLCSDCHVDGKCRHGGQTPHPTPPNVRERNSSQCQCLLAGTRECIRGRSERLWHDQSLAVGYAARRLAPERKRQLTPRKIFGTSRVFASAAIEPEWPRPSAKGKAPCL